MSTPILNAVVLQKSMNMAQVLGFFFLLKKRTQTFFFKFNKLYLVFMCCSAQHYRGAAVISVSSQQERLGV